MITSISSIPSITWLNPESITYHRELAFPYDRIQLFKIIDFFLIVVFYNLSHSISKSSFFHK